MEVMVGRRHQHVDIVRIGSQAFFGHVESLCLIAHLDVNPEIVGHQCALILTVGTALL